jgi:hypothetical protein
MSASLIRSRAMVTHAVDRHRWNEITDGAVLQEDGAIVEIGTYRDLSRRHRNVAVVGSGNEVMLPGFVNGHHHFAILSDFFRLHVWQRSWIFSSEFPPPFATGMMWSKCNSCFDPHRTQHPPSRAQTNNFTSSGIGSRLGPDFWNSIAASRLATAARRLDSSASSS